MRSESQRARDFLAEKRLKQINAKADATTVRTELLRCLEENDLPRIPAKTVKSARDFRDKGEAFPTTAALSLVFGDCL